MFKVTQQLITALRQESRFPASLGCPKNTPACVEPRGMEKKDKKSIDCEAKQRVWN